MMADRKYPYRNLTCLTLGMLLLGGCELGEPIDAEPADAEQPEAAGELQTNAKPTPRMLGLDMDCAMLGGPIIAKVPEDPNGGYECAFPGMPGSWSAKPLFAEGSPWIEQQLDGTPLPTQSPLNAYCKYEYLGNDPATDYAAFMEIADEHTDGAATDCPSITTQRGLYSPELLTAESDLFMQSVGAVDGNDLAALGLGVVHTYLLDTKQTGVSVIDSHAEHLRTMLEDLACADDRSGCTDAIHEIMVTPLRDTNHYRAYWGFNTSTVSGGSHGYVHQTALGVVLAVQDWLERNDDGDPETLERGVINLSVGAIESGSYSTDLAYAPAQAVADSLRMAACYGLPVFAAAGNRDVADVNCMDPGSNLLLPAAYETLARPTAVQCQAWGYAADWNTTTFPVHTGSTDALVTAVTAVDHADVGLPSNRLDSTARQLAPGALALTPSGTTPMTGSSAAALVVSAGANLVWSADPTLPPTAVTDQLYDLGYATGFDADAGTFAGYPVRRISLCAALDASVGSLGCDAEAPILDASATIGAATQSTIAQVELAGDLVSPGGGVGVDTNPVCEQQPVDLVLPQPFRPACPWCNVGVDAGAGGLDELNMTIQLEAWATDLTVSSATLYMTDGDGTLTSYSLSKSVVNEINATTPTSNTIIQVFFDHPDPNPASAMLKFKYTDASGGTYSENSTLNLW